MLYSDSTVLQAKHLNQQIAQLKGEKSGKYLMMKANNNFLLLWGIHKLYPNSIFINTHRDPRDMATALYGAGFVAGFTRKIKAIASVVGVRTAQ